MHHMSDAIALPGCYPFSNPAPVNNGTDVILKNADTEFRIKPNGHLQILNKHHELLRILDEWITLEMVGAHHMLGRVRAKLRTFLEK